jgi:prepilin-type N-terminal cleavage/methylation domain-containing protein
MLDWIYTRTRDEEGVTLVELIIVMVLIAILATLGAGTYRNYINTAYDRQAKSNLEEANAAAEEIFQQDRKFSDSATVVMQLQSLRPERRFFAMPANPANIDSDDERLQGPHEKPAIYVRSAPSTGDEEDTGQVTLCTESRSEWVFCLRTSQEVGLRLEPNGEERTGQVRSRAKSFAMAMRIADGNEEADAPSAPCEGTGSTDQDCLINTDRTGWTSRDRGVSSASNGAPTVKLACETQSTEACPEEESGSDTALFTWIVSGGWRAPYAASHNPPGVRCYLDLREVTDDTDCATDNQARLTRAMLSVKNNGADPFGSHVFVVRAINAEGSSETSYSWTILPGIPKVAITPINRAADDIPERCYQSATVSGLAQWIDKTFATPSCSGADVVFSDRAGSPNYSRPTDSFVPAYPNRYEAVQYRRASFRWHADLEATSPDDRIEQVYCLIERPVPGYASGDPNYPGFLTGDLTATQDDDWQLVTPSAGAPDANYPCPGAVQHNSGRNWTGTISAETFAGFPLPFHNDIPYRITVVATNQSGASVKQRFIWFISDRIQGPGTKGQNICFSPRTSLTSNGTSGFAIPQGSNNPVSGIHRVIWPQVDSSYIGPSGSPINGRVDDFFSGPAYPANLPSGYDSNDAASNLYRLGSWPSEASYPAHNATRYFFPVVENGSPPYFPAIPAASLASGTGANDYQTQALYLAHQDHINVGDFSMTPDLIPPGMPSVSTVGGSYSLSSGGPYYNISDMTLHAVDDPIGGSECAKAAVRLEYRERGSLDSLGDQTGGYTGWATVPASGNITVSRQGQTEVQFRGVDAVGNTNGQSPSDPAVTTYYVHLDRTDPAVQTQAGSYSYTTEAEYNPTSYSDGNGNGNPNCGEAVTMGNWSRWTRCSISMAAGGGADPHTYSSGRRAYQYQLRGALTAGTTEANAFFWNTAAEQGVSYIKFRSCDNAQPTNNCSAFQSTWDGAPQEIQEEAQVAFDIVDPPQAGAPFVANPYAGDSGPGTASEFANPNYSAGILSNNADIIIWNASQPNDNLSGVYLSALSYCPWFDNTAANVNLLGNDWRLCDPDQSANVTFNDSSPTLNRTISGLAADKTYSAQLRTTDRAGNVSVWSPIGTGVTKPSTTFCDFNVLAQCGITVSQPSSWPSDYESGTYETTGSAKAEAGHPWGGTSASGDNATSLALGTAAFNGNGAARVTFAAKGDAVAFDFGTRSGSCDFTFRARSDDNATYLMGFIGDLDNNMEQFPNSDPDPPLLGPIFGSWARYAIHPDRVAGPGANTHFVIQRWSSGGGSLWIDNLYVLGC